MRKIFTGIWLLAASVMTFLLLPTTEEANAYEPYDGKFLDYSTTIYWYVNNNLDSVLNVTNADVNAEISAVLWDDNNISGTALNFVKAPSESLAQVYLTTTQVTGEPAGFTDCERPSSFIEDCDIFLNSVDFTWSISGTMDQTNDIADVRTVSLHEFGHSVGWDDRWADLEDCDPNTSTGEGNIQWNSTMCVDWTTQQFLNNEDKEGMRTYYFP